MKTLVTKGWLWILAALLTIFFWADISSAGTITRQMSFTWTYTVAEEADITGFKIYQYALPLTPSAATVVIDNIPKTTRFATATLSYDSAKSQRLFIRAVDESDPANPEYSGDSNIIKLIAAPSGFKRN